MSGGYRVLRTVRELVVFAQHNVLADPPFSRLDLVSCRNLFIYLDRNLHQQVTELFHYALKPDGLLLLGTSESIDESELFQPEDKKHHIYRRRHVAAPEPRLPVFSLARPQPADRPPVSRPQPEASTFGAFHQRVVEQYAPPSVLLSPDDHVVHFSAHAGRYLVHPGGAPTTSVFQVVRDELRVELRSALSAARSQRKTVRTEPISVRFDRRIYPVVLDVRPVLDDQQQGYVLLIFDERSAPETPARSEGRRSKQVPKAGAIAKIRQLESDKKIAEQRFHEIVKEYETGRENLRASNEELQSANEELRSTLEELETSKEELQSVNEELQTVNQENRHKVEELAQLSSDLQNLFAATDIATVFLDRELRILRFTPKTADLFNVQTSDRGRPLSNFTHRLGYDGLEDDARQVLEQLAPIQREVLDTSGRWYVMRMLPYRAVDRIAGLVITFVEITQRKEMEDALRLAKEYSEQVIAALPEPFLVLTSDLTIESANSAFYAHFLVTPEMTIGRKVYDLGNGQWNIPALRELLEKVLPENHVFDGYVVDHVFEGIGRRVMLVNGRQVDHLQRILLAVSDITDRWDANERLVEADRRKNEFLAMLSHELRNPLAPIRNSLYVLDRAAPGGEQARRAQLIIDRQVGHMTRIVEDLLDVTRITRGKSELHREILDLNELTRRTVEDHRAAFVGSGVEIEMQGASVEVWVNGDRTRLSQVIGNLLQNAVKFTPRGGKTSVSVEGNSVRREAIVRVRDTGRGIAPEVLPHVFEPFTQADATLDRKKGGLGLGLALVKGVVEMHGGSVGGESAGRDQGATFTIVLPLESAGPVETQHPPDGAVKPTRRVLVIEDSADGAISLRDLLEISGHVVEVASSGPEGIEMARSFKPDVVLCDIGLPEMDGYTVAKAMRADPDLGRAGLVALSGYARPEDVERAREAGFVAHLAKPLSLEALERIMAAAGSDVSDA